MHLNEFGDCIQSISDVTTHNSTTVPIADTFGAIYLINLILLPTIYVTLFALSAVVPLPSSFVSKLERQYHFVIWLHTTRI